MSILSRALEALRSCDDLVTVGEQIEPVSYSYLATPADSPKWHVVKVASREVLVSVPDMNDLLHTLGKQLKFRPANTTEFMTYQVGSVVKVSLGILSAIEPVIKHSLVSCKPMVDDVKIIHELDGQVVYSERKVAIFVFPCPFDLLPPGHRDHRSRIPIGMLNSMLPQTQV